MRDQVLVVAESVANAECESYLGRDSDYLDKVILSVEDSTRNY